MDHYRNKLFAEKLAESLREQKMPSDRAAFIKDMILRGEQPVIVIDSPISDDETLEMVLARAVYIGD